MTIRLLIADDHPTFVRTLSAVIASEDLRVVGTAASGDEAVEQAFELQPDIVLMDLNMPGLDGIEATRRISAAAPHIGVVVLTMFDDDDSVFAAMQAGARGYLIKGASRAEIVRAVETVARGEAIFGSAIARRLRSFFNVERNHDTADATVTPFPTLTQREREVLDELAAGRDNAQIARHLGLSPKTVRNYMSTVFIKLHVASRAEAIVKARDAGLGR